MDLILTVIFRSSDGNAEHAIIELSAKPPRDIYKRNVDYTLFVGKLGEVSIQDSFSNLVVEKFQIEKLSEKLNNLTENFTCLVMGHTNYFSFVNGIITQEDITQNT